MILETTLADVPGYTIIQPITVSVVGGPGSYIAEARDPKLNLCGRGKSVEQALSNLAYIIANYADLLFYPTVKTVGTVDELKEKIREHLKPK